MLIQPTKKDETAFSLLEVVIASALFFMTMFSILGVMTRGLEQARSLQQLPPDVSSIASLLSITNVLEEGSESGDFGELYPETTWTRNAYEVGSNGLFQVDFYVNTQVRGKNAQQVTSILLYRPQSSSSAIGATRRIQ